MAQSRRSDEPPQCRVPDLAPAPSALQPRRWLIVDSSQLDIAANRRAAKWSAKALLGRALWEFAAPLFALSPRQFWGWRILLLRFFGARVGRHVHVHPTVKIAIPWNLEIGDFAAVGDGVILYCLGPIRIGARATISQHAHLCAGSHDHRDAAFPLLKLSIAVEEGVWICADAFVGPGVTVASHAIVGARGVIMRDVAPWTIVAGNPATVVGGRPKPKSS